MVTQHDRAAPGGVGFFKQNSRAIAVTLDLEGEKVSTSRRLNDTAVSVALFTTMPYLVVATGQDSETCKRPLHHIRSELLKGTTEESGRMEKSPVDPIHRNHR